MKNIIKQVGLVIVLLGSLSALSSAYAEYTLVCSGGKNMKIQLFPYEQHGMQNTKILFTFKKHNKKGDINMPEGSCAWLDRGMRPSEPNKMRLNFLGAHVAPVFETARLKNKMTVKLSDVRGKKPAAKRKLGSFLNFVQSGNIARFIVRNKGNIFYVKRFDSGFLIPTNPTRHVVD